MRFENKKQRKFNQLIKQLLLNYTEFNNTNNSNNIFKLSLYGHDSYNSLDNRYFDFYTNEKNNKKGESD